MGQNQAMSNAADALHPPRLFGGLSAAHSRLQGSDFQLSIGCGYLLTDTGASKPRNEDVILIAEQQHLLGIFDGIGGCGDGHRAARLCANLVAQSAETLLSNRLQHADQQLKKLGKQKLLAQNAGCCAALLQVVHQDNTRSRTTSNNKTLKIQLAYTGDCKTIVLRPMSETFAVLYDSDDLPGGFSYLLKQRFASQLHQQLQSHYYFRTRHRVEQPLSALADNKPKIIMPPLLSLQSKDMILMMSDGIADNLATEEIIAIMQHVKMQNALQQKTSTPKLYAQAIFITTSQRQRYFLQRNTTADQNLASQLGQAHSQAHSGFYNALPTTSRPAWLQPAKLDNNALVCLQL